MVHTPVTQLLGIAHPITQGGLAHLAYAGLAAAVSEAGGLGQVTATTLPSPEALREEIATVRALTSKPFSVNFQIGRRDLSDLVAAAAAERVPVMSFTAGDPARYFQLIEGTGIKKMCLVASVRQAQHAEELGADVVIAVGFEGGGHIGRDDIGAMVLVPRIAESVRIPVLASGGFADGRGLAAALALGAAGVEMGTRFIATQECIAHINYKQALVDAQETDTLVVERSVGRPARVLRTPLAEAILEIERGGGTLEDLLPFISGEMNLVAAHQGDMEGGFVWAGQVVGLIHDIPTVQELVQRTVAEAEGIVRQWRQQTDTQGG
ncbi:MAG: nitronate monooxygenase [Chloroflexi bacterium]|nr:nitronate monooxygenase [Chloroflexota bacterium]